ncbi:MAG: hypothetical protein ACOYNC_02570 [Bacteroidales bacterium]
MKTKNNLDKTFGPSGSFAGLILLAAGIILVYFYFSGFTLILIGGFVGLTSTSAMIDDDKKRVKFSNNIFGIISIGKWIPVVPSMKIFIKELQQTYRSYSQGNRAHDLTKKDFRLMLTDANGAEIMPLKKTQSLDSAKAECELMATRLGLTVA